MTIGYSDGNAYEDEFHYAVNKLDPMGGKETPTAEVRGSPAIPEEDIQRLMGKDTSRAPGVEKTPMQRIVETFSALNPAGETIPHTSPILGKQQPTRLAGPIEAAMSTGADIQQRRFGKPYETQLNPREEAAFQTWKQQYAPKDSGADYDLRGAYKEGLRPDPETGHWPDTYKKPNHPTFSNESIYAKDRPDLAGHWEGPQHDKYIPPAYGHGNLGPASENVEDRRTGIGPLNELTGGLIRQGTDIRQDLQHPLTPRPYGGRQDIEDISEPGGQLQKDLGAPLIIRHGATDYNMSSGGEKGQEYIRGHIDVDLNAKGREQAENMATDIAEKGHIGPGDLIISSDLSRAHDTAKAIQKATGALVMTDPGLRPWDLGDFQGKPVKDCQAQIEGYCLNTPDKPVPNGESFNEFKDRASDALIRAAQMGAAGIVTHHRVDRLDAATQPDGSIDFDKFLSKGEETGTYRPAKLAMADEETLSGKVIRPNFPAVGPSPSGGAARGPAEIKYLASERYQRQLDKMSPEEYWNETKSLYEGKVSDINKVKEQVFRERGYEGPWPPPPPPAPKIERKPSIRDRLNDLHEDISDFLNSRKLQRLENQLKEDPKYKEIAPDVLKLNRSTFENSLIKLRQMINESKIERGVKLDPVDITPIK